MCVLCVFFLCSTLKRTRQGTQKQTATSIVAELERKINKRKSNNPHGYTKQQRAALSWVGRAQRKERAKRKKNLDVKKRNAAKKMRRRLKTEQEAVEMWVGLKDAYEGNVLAVYKTRDPEENESIAYDDNVRDRLTDYQEKRLWPQWGGLLGW